MEQEAKDWAKQCKFSLGPPGVAGYGTGNKYGQNIWARRLDESNHTAIGDKDAWRHYNSFIHEDDDNVYLKSNRLCNLEVWLKTMESGQYVS